MYRSFRSLLGFGVNQKSARQTNKHFKKVKFSFDSLEERITPATLWVDNTPGSGGTQFTAVGGTQPASVPGLTPGVNIFSTIAAAVTAASPGDTINVADGAYSESVNVNKTLTIQGNQFGVDARTRSVTETVVNAAGGNTQFTLAANGVAIDGFTIQGQTSTTVGASIYMKPGQNGSQIRNNIIQNNVIGILVANNSASQTVIEKNLLRNNTNGGAAGGTDIYADQFTAGVGMQNVLVQNNSFANTFSVEDTWAFGISNSAATPFSNITFTNNLVTNHGRGAYFFNTNGATVSGNTFMGASHYGVALFALNGTPANAAISITNNIVNVNGSGGSGVLLEDGTASDAYTGTLTLTGNQYTTSGTDRSIDVESTTNVDATGETFNTISAAIATTQQQFAIVDTILDGIDVPGLAFARTKAANVYVTPNSFLNPITTTPNIQRAVDVAAASGDTINIQSGTYSGNVSTAAKSVTLSPGAGPVQVINNGNLTLDGNDTLALEINGISVSSGFDNLIVNGATNLGGATLTINGTYVPALGDVFTIVSAGSVSNIFAGKPNGSTVVLNGVSLTVNYTATTVTLTDNETAIVSVAATTNGNEAGPTNGQFTVTLAKKSATNTVINYSVGGTATPGSDYTALSGSVTILAGNTTAVIPVQVIDDSLVEGVETVIVTLTGIASGNAGISVNPTPATLNIVDNDTITGTVSATLDGSGNLLVTDTFPGGKNNRFSVTIVGGNIVVADTTEQFATVPAGWTLAPDGKSISRPIAGFTGTITINGGPGTDKLAVRGDGTTSAAYTPSATTPGSGAVVLSGGPISTPLTINFLNFEPVDISGMLLAAVQSPVNSANALVLNAGFDSFTGVTNPAIVVSGTTGAGTGIESASLFNNTIVAIDTSTTTGAGANTITVSSALTTSPGINSLTLKTNANGAVTVNAAVTVPGSLNVTSPTANLNADLTAATMTGSATTVNVVPPGQLQDAANIVASGGTIFLAPGTYSGNVAMTNPFNLSVPSGTATVTGNLTGSPGLTKIGGGTLVLTGVNSYSGNTSVTGGRLQISNDNQLGNASGTVSVTSPAVLEITANTTTNRTIFLNNNATLQINSGITLTMTGGEIDGGTIAGPGTLTTSGPSLTAFNGGQSGSTLTLNANFNASFIAFTNNGTMNLAATRTFTLSNFTNTLTGKLFVNGTANVSDFVSNGQLDVGTTGLLANVGVVNGLTFGGGSVTTVNRSGALDNVNDGRIELGTKDALLAGGTITNDGFVNSPSGVRLVVSVGGLAKGTGFYNNIITINGGRYSPGGSPGSGLISNFDINGGGIFEFEIANATGVAGAPSGWDLLTIGSFFNSDAKSTFSATPTDKYTVRLLSRLNSGDYNAPGAAANFDPHQSYAWKFFDASSPTVALTGAFDPAAFNIDASGFANSIAGSFSIASNDGGKSLSIVYTPAPTTVATSTTLMISPLATTGGTLVSMSATVAPSPGAIGKVTFLDNGVPISGGADVAVSGGVALFSTTFTTSVNHSITAAYTGNTMYLNSTSNAETIVSNTAPPPQVLSVTTNGGVAGLNGSQHSRIVDLTIVFDQAVQLDTNAMVLGLHTNNVSYGGVPQAAGMGAIPATLNVTHSADNKTFTITFEGAGTVETGTDALSSLKDGVYKFTIDATKVHPVGVLDVNMAANSTTVVHRLFGDMGAASQTGNDFVAVVNTSDNLQFRAAFNKTAGAGYVPYLDFNGDGIINSFDNLLFRQRFNKILTWTI